MEEEKPKRKAMEFMVIVLTGVVAFYLVSATIYVVLTEIRTPEVDTSGVVDDLSTMITAILGALLGLLAGRSSK